MIIDEIMVVQKQDIFVSGCPVKNTKLMPRGAAQDRVHRRDANSDEYVEIQECRGRGVDDKHRAPPCYEEVHY